MAYYIKKDKEKKTPDQTPQPHPNQKYIYKLLGCFIVLIIFLIIRIVRGA